MIPLTMGHHALIDVDSLPLISGFNWYAKKNKTVIYAARSQVLNGAKMQILMHREILKTPSNMHTDHIDGNGLNNTRSNLRHVSHDQNMQNRANLSSNKSGFKGVHWSSSINRWVAQIRYKGKRIYLGVFKSAEDASVAYAKASAKLHGEFGRTE